ncbi:MAG: tetratricopeptide repeat protein [Ignavibacteria bacterium]|nr:tetratricopeptide repeat protein [Ignavibacteria bacterium]
MKSIFLICFSFTVFLQRILFSQDAAFYSKQGDSLYYLKEYEGSVNRYEQSLQIDPLNADVIYNAACVYSLLGKTDAAFGKLEELPGLGYENVRCISKDSDLEKLRDDVRWRALLEKLQGNLDKRKNIGNMKIVTTDISNFWDMYDAYKNSGSIDDISNLYFAKKSAGLNAFTKRRVINPKEMEKVLKAYPRYLESIRSNTLKLAGVKDKLRRYFLKLKEIYPDVYYPDIYFTIGCFNTGGTVSGRMLLIGAEMMCADENSPKDELNNWLKGNIGEFSNIEKIVLHESIHTLQATGSETLLEASIIEGACDFITYLITGKEMSAPHYIYGNKYEKGLWKEFKKEMNSTGFQRWLYSGEYSVGRPSDLGYFIGYKICEAYYENAEDKQKAVKEIIEVEDFANFLKKSRYEEKFD